MNGFTQGYDWPIVLLVAFALLLGGVWLISKLLEVSNQRAMRQMLRGGFLETKTRPPRPPASQDELQGNIIRGKSVRITDLISDTSAAPVISNKTFENCDIFGPAVVAAIAETQWLGSSFSGAQKVDEIFLPIETPRHLTGIIALEYCVFRNCRISGIAIADSPENTYYNKKGRACRECHRELNRRWWHSRKEKQGV